MDIKEENRQTETQIQEIRAILQAFYEANNQLIRTVQENADNIAMCAQYMQHLQKDCDDLRYEFLKLLEANCNNLKYELMDPMGVEKKYFYPKFRSNEETLRLIVEDKKSLARFGDGEFSIAFHIPRQQFQRLDDRLALRIREVLQSEPPEKLLIAIANHYGNLERFNEAAAQGIRVYMTEENRCRHQQLLSTNRVYSDAYITRPYVMYKDVLTDAPKKRFEALKRIWKDKRIIVAEGAQTRLGVGNDLFAQAKEVKRILAPPTSSFDRYDDIYRECLKYGDMADMFLLAIGPSSGVLAYDLTLKGYQAVDVGHIDLEYEWFLAGKGTRVSIPYKYNNEFEGGDKVEDIHDALYESQIIASCI